MISSVGLPPASRVELSWVESRVTTDGQSASVFWNKAPTWGLRPDLYYCQTVAGFLMWSALSDERTGLLFTIAARPRQCSHSLVRVPRRSRPYFTVSDFPFRRLLRLAGLRGRYSSLSPHWSQSHSQRYNTTNGQSASLCLLRMNCVSFCDPMWTTNRTHNWTVRVL
jgi:hypothetical protein